MFEFEAARQKGSNFVNARRRDWCNFRWRRDGGIRWCYASALSFLELSGIDVEVYVHTLQLQFNMENRVNGMHTNWQRPMGRVAINCIVVFFYFLFCACANVFSDCSPVSQTLHRNPFQK